MTFLKVSVILVGKQPIVLVSIVDVFRLRGAISFRGDLAMKRERFSRKRLG
jgi:hypothetical protein